MFDDLNAQLAAIKEQLAKKAEFSDALPKARESLGEEQYQLAQLEGALEHVESEIEALQALTLQCLWDSILGRKRGKLDRLSGERQALQARCGESEEKVESVEQAIAALEEQLAELGDPEAELQTLLDRQQESILGRHDEVAAKLREVLNELDAVRTARQKLDKAIQTGKHATERLHSLTKAIGRANTKNIGARSVGIIGGAVINSVLRGGSRPALDRARQGLRNFGRDAAQIDLDAKSELDAEIARLIAVVTESGGSLTGAVPAMGSGNMGVTLPVLEVVQSLLGHLGTKLDQSNGVIKQLEQQRRGLLEQAVSALDVSCAGEVGTP